jgi:uncharacterized protein (TIGR02271 family)
MRTVIGLLEGTGEARDTVRELKGMGIRSDQISVLSRDAAIGKEVEGMTLKPIPIAGLGTVAAGGPMLQFLTPATAESNAEAIVSALIRMGVPREESLAYVDGVRSGLTLEAAIVDDENVGRAVEIMRAHTHEVEPVLGSVAAGVEEMEMTIPVVEEELRVGKREVPAGRVRISTHVIEEPVVEEISLRTEQISVERRPATQPIKEPDEALFKERTIEVTATTEEPVVAKQARIVEEVVVRKEAQAHTETVHDTVRKTDVDVRSLPPFEASRYQEHFREIQTRLGASERIVFETYEPAYRFGHELRTEPRYTTEEWPRIEADVRTTWEKRSPGTWDRFKDAIRHAWERAKA